MSGSWCLVPLLIATARSSALAPALAGVTTRVSLSSTGEEANGSADWYPAWKSAISADGRFVAFSSSATNLVPGDTDGQDDVFVRDRMTGSTERVSVSSAGLQANGASRYPAISGNGRFVVFMSYASDLVPSDTNNESDVFIHDRLTATTERVSVSTSGQQGNGYSWFADVSPDGRFVAFLSRATNFWPQYTWGFRQIFVRDRLTETTELVSVSSAGSPGASDCWYPSISADGRFVAFDSAAGNLVPGDANSQVDVFVRDRWSGTTERVSVSSAGVEGNGISMAPSISADGMLVAFDSDASNLVLDDTNGGLDIFVRDRQNGTTERVSVSSTGEQANSGSDSASISAGGRFVAFESFASNLAPGDANWFPDVYVRDRLNGTTVLVSISSAGESGNDDSGCAWVTPDGRFVAFQSKATNLVAGDANGVPDVFVRDRWPETVPPETVITFGPCGLVVSSDSETMCWGGSDNDTLSTGLRYSRRIDSGTWSPFSYETCADLTGLPHGTHTFEVMAKDVAENMDPTPAQCQFTVDLSGPTIATTSPAHGTTVKGVVEISATASHGSGIQKVEFYAGGQLLSTATSAPYSCLWDTRPVSVAEGTTQVCAKAYANDEKAAWACVLVTVDNTTFDDVPKTSSQCFYVEALLRQGITTGCSATPPLYCPSGTITRAQMAVFIVRAMGQAPYDNPTPTFEDVPRSHSAYGYIEKMYQMGITGGCSTSPTLYCPFASVTRSQMAVFLCRATGRNWLDPGTPTFADVLSSASFYGYVERLADPASWGGTAVTSGCAVSPRRYCPYSAVTRGQMAVFIVRAFGIDL